MASISECGNRYDASTVRAISACCWSGCCAVLLACSPEDRSMRGPRNTLSGASSRPGRDGTSSGMLHSGTTWSELRLRRESLDDWIEAKMDCIMKGLGCVSSALSGIDWLWADVDEIAWIDGSTPEEGLSVQKLTARMSSSLVLLRSSRLKNRRPRTYVCPSWSVIRYALPPCRISFIIAVLYHFLVAWCCIHTLSPTEKSEKQAVFLSLFLHLFSCRSCLLYTSPSPRDS